MRSEVFHEIGPRHCRKSSEVATDPEFDFSTSGNAARRMLGHWRHNPQRGL